MTYIIPLQILSIQDDGFHLAFQAHIGNTAINMLLDTGASRTVFDKTRIMEILNLQEGDLTDNPGPSGGIGTLDLQTSVTVINEFKIGEVGFNAYQAALIDLSQVNFLFHSIGLPPVHGILGGDLLEQTQAIIDYGKKTMKFKVAIRKSRR
ncbi:MAG: aspartyl protease family protein [Bacteroidales bacterium]